MTMASPVIRSPSAPGEPHGASLQPATPISNPRPRLEPAIAHLACLTRGRGEWDYNVRLVDWSVRRGEPSHGFPVQRGAGAVPQERPRLRQPGAAQVMGPGAGEGRASVPARAVRQ